MCSLRFENNLFSSEGVRFASISKKTLLSKLSFAFVSLALPLLVRKTEGNFDGILCSVLSPDENIISVKLFLEQIKKCISKPVATRITLPNQSSTIY